MGVADGDGVLLDDVDDVDVDNGDVEEMHADEVEVLGEERDVEPSFWMTGRCFVTAVH